MKSRFEEFHPLVSFIFFVLALSLFILMIHPVFLLLGLIFILMINITYRSIEQLRQWAAFMIISSLFIFLLNPLFNERGRHVLFVFHQHRITVESLVYGGMSALSLVVIMAMFVSYNKIMTPNKLLFLFSKILPQFAVLLMLTLRFIPLMKRRLDEISSIQLSKGISVLHGPLNKRVKTGLLYVQVLLTYSLEEAIQTADSMKAREYGKGLRSSYEYFKFKKRDGLALVYLLLLFLLILWGRFKGFGHLTVYPIMESWQLGTGDIRIMVFYCLFLGFPLLIELGGYFRWRILN